MSDMTERYEAEAEAFYKATGVMAPGKDSPAAMGGYDADELRHKLWRMWARAVYAERERDEARAAIGTLRELVGCRSRNVGDVDMPTHTREIMEAVRHRAERAERVVEAAKRFDSAWDVASVTDEGLGLPPLLRCVPEIRSLCEAVRALDAHHASEGEGEHPCP